MSAVYPARAFNLDAELPEDLTEVDRWVCWKYTSASRAGKPGKQPCHPHTLGNLEWSDEGNLLSFDAAVDAYRANPRINGIGIVLNAGMGLVGGDIDHAIERGTGEVAEWALAHVNDLDTYTEVTPGADGFRYFLRGTLPADAPRKVGNREIYSEGRFLTITGNVWRDDPVRSNDAALGRYIAAMQGERGERTGPSGHSSGARSNSELVAAVMRGEELHDSTRDYTFRLVADGMQPSKIVETVRGLMLAMPDRGDPERWQERFDDIPRLVRGAEGRAPVAQGSTGGFTWGDALTDRANLRPSEWTIRKILPLECTGLLYGGWGTCKTFLAIDWACCIANGIDWHGKPTHAGTVFYLAGEGEGGFARRLAAWEAGNAGTASNLAFREMPEVRDRATLTAVEVEIEALAKERGPPRLIVLDTLFTALNGGDENSGRDMGEVFRAMKQLRRRFRCAVFAVHHTGKSGEDSRGHSSMPAGVDVQFYLKAKDNGGAHFLELTNPKQKDGKKHAPIMLTTQLVAIPGLFDEEEEQESSLVIRAPSADMVAAMHAKRDEGEDLAVLRVKAAELKAQGLTLEEIGRAVGRDKGTVSRWLKL